MRPKDSIRWILRVFGWPISSRMAYQDIACHLHLLAPVSSNDVIAVRVSDKITVQDTQDLIRQGDDPRRSWFQFLAYCIPKSISEPWLGDIRERRETMRLEGYSQRAITWATISQFALLFLNWGIYKALDVLMPFKKPKVE
jgi:hypothetical protein